MPPKEKQQQERLPITSIKHEYGLFQIAIKDMIDTILNEQQPPVDAKTKFALRSVKTAEQWKLLKAGEGEAYRGFSMEFLAYVHAADIERYHMDKMRYFKKKEAEEETTVAEAVDATDD